MPLFSVTGPWLTLHGAMVLLGLGIYVTTSRARRQRRHPSAAMAWVVSLALLPYVALPLYLMVGGRKIARGSPLPRQPLPPGLAHQPDTPAVRFQQLAAAMGLPPAAECKALAIHQNGLEALQALRAVMAGARQTLDVSTFLFGRDALGREVTDRLVQCASQGVRVRLMIDGVGIYLGGRPDLARLTKAGVQVALFVSPWRSALPGRTNLRNHRKLVIADGARLWSGGRNLAAEYFVGDPATQPPKTPWTDLTFDLGGGLATQAQALFEHDWCFATQAPRPAPLPAAEPPPGDQQPAAAPACAQLVPSGPDQADDTVYELIISSCFTARRRILAVTPYFVPDDPLLMALTLAARRGLQVDLVLPRRSNHRLADIARNMALRDMAAAGAKVWLTETMVHAKAFIIDDDLALAGSANLDERSLFLNYELMVAFYDPQAVQGFTAWVEHQCTLGTRYRPERPGVWLEFGEGLVRWLAFQL